MGFLGYRSEYEIENVRLVYYCSELKHKIECFLHEHQIVDHSVLYLFGTTEEPKDIRKTIPDYCNSLQKIINKYFSEYPEKRNKARKAYLDDLEYIKKKNLDKLVDIEIRRRFIREHRENLFKVFDTDFQLSAETISKRIKEVYKCSEERVTEIYSDYKSNGLLNKCSYEECNIENIFDPDKPEDEFMLSRILNKRTKDMEPFELTRDEWLKEHNKINNKG